MSLLARFGGKASGNDAVMFAIAIIPVVGAVGAAIDYARINGVRAKLADALVAGVAAIGNQPKMTEAQAFATVRNVLNARMGPDDAQIWRLNSVTEDGQGHITAVASGSVDTAIGRIIGLDRVPVSVRSEAFR